MSFERWMNYIKDAEKSSIISGTTRKIHYKFKDDAEMMEEYSMETGILLRRAWKKKRNMLSTQMNTNCFDGSIFHWNIELGDIYPATYDSNCLVKESNTTPILTKRLTRYNIEWRIRNLSYPLETYLVTADQIKKALIVRTTNKKYFKEIDVPELSRCDLYPQQDAIVISHQHNTLIISYRKPNIVKQMEEETLRVLQNISTEINDDTDSEN